MALQQVKFYKTSKAPKDIVNVDSSGIYYVDEGEIYRGDDRYGLAKTYHRQNNEAISTITDMARGDIAFGWENDYGIKTTKVYDGENWNDIQSGNQDFNRLPLYHADENSITIDGHYFAYKVEADEDYDVDFTINYTTGDIVEWELHIQNTSDNDIYLSNITAMDGQSEPYSPSTYLEVIKANLEKQDHIILAHETQVFKFRADLDSRTLVYYPKYKIASIKPTYSFGVISDIHVTSVDKADESKVVYSYTDLDGTTHDHLASESHIGSKDGGYQDFEHALEVFSNLGIDMVCCTGDMAMSATSNTQMNYDLGNVTDILKNKFNFQDNVTGGKFFICTGNHDQGYCDNANPVNTSDCSGSGDSFVAGPNYNPGGREAASSGRGADLVDWVTDLKQPKNVDFDKEGDRFYFMSFERRHIEYAYRDGAYPYRWFKWSNGPNSSWEKPETAKIARLDEVLADSEGQLLFLFMHFPLNNTQAYVSDGEHQYWDWAPFPGIRDNPANDSGGDNYYGFSRKSPESREILERLLHRKGQTIVFSGHTHVYFQAESKYPYMNYRKISDRLQLFHVPSLNYIRDENWAEVATDSPYRQMSQGYVVDVYDHKIVVKGYEFNPTFSCAPYMDQKNYGKWYKQYTYTIKRLSSDEVNQIYDEDPIHTIHHEGESGYEYVKNLPYPARHLEVRFRKDTQTEISGSMSNQIITLAESGVTGTPLTPNAYARDGYTFTGWDTANTASTVVYEDGAVLTRGQGAANTYEGNYLSLYPVWTENS